MCYPHRLGAQEASVSWQPPNLAGTELGGCAAFRAWSYSLEMEDSQGAAITKRGLQGTRVSLNKSDQLQPSSLYKVWLVTTNICPHFLSRSEWWLTQREEKDPGASHGLGEHCQVQSSVLP